MDVTTATASLKAEVNTINTQASNTLNERVNAEIPKALQTPDVKQKLKESASFRKDYTNYEKTLVTPTQKVKSVGKAVGETAIAFIPVANVVYGARQQVKAQETIKQDGGLFGLNPEGEAKISVTSPEQLQAFIDREERLLKEMTGRIFSSGANVVFCQKGIDDVAQYYLAKAGIYACRRISRSDMEKLARATGGHIVSDIKSLSSPDLGKAKIVREVLQGEDKMTYVEGCENPKSVSILITFIPFSNSLYSYVLLSFIYFNITSLLINLLKSFYISVEIAKNYHEQNDLIGLFSQTPKDINAKDIDPYINKKFYLNYFSQFQFHGLFSPGLIK
jgi:hypothetical protein